MTELWSRFWGYNWWIKGAVLGVLFLVVVGIIGAAVGGGDDDDSADKEVTAPTATTTAPATATTIPEAPTEPALPAFTAAECAYMETMVGLNTDVGDATVEMTELFGDFADDPLVLFDQDWIFDMAGQLAILRVVFDSSGDVLPPASMTAIHDQLLAAYSKLNDATTAYATGFDDVDPDAINEGNALIAEANADMTAGNRLLTDFVDAHTASC